MATKKINIGLAISRNYDKVSLEMVEEPVEVGDNENLQEELLREGIRKRFEILREEIIKEFGNIQK